MNHDDNIVLGSAVFFVTLIILMMAIQLKGEEVKQHKDDNCTGCWEVVEPPRDPVLDRLQMMEGDRR